MPILGINKSLAIAEKFKKFSTWTYHLDSKLFSHSNNLFEILGLPVSNKCITIQKLSELIDEETKVRIINEFEQAIKHYSEFDIQITYSTPSGSIKKGTIKAQIEKDQTAEKIILSGIFEENIVSKAKEEEEENAKNNKIEAFLSNNFDAFVIVTEQFESTYISKSVKNILGFSTDQLLKINFSSLIQNEDLNKFLHCFLEAEKNIGVTITCNSVKINKSNNNWIITDINITNFSSEPSINGILLQIKDITKIETANSRLKLMESAVANSSDAILITEAEPFDLPGPKIVYANKAFCKMTGYTIDELIGRTPRILQGPKTDKNELTKLGKALRGWKQVEINLLNYKKSGEEFWNNINLSPIANDKGIYTHWIAIERNITQKKEIDSENTLLRELSKLFLEQINLNKILSITIQELLNHTDASMGEIWLITTNKKNLYAAAREHRTENMKMFYDETQSFNIIEENKGLRGIAWKNKQIQFWDNVYDNPDFIRKEAAIKYGLKSFYTIPLITGEEVIGVLCLGFELQNHSRISFEFLRKLSNQLAAEIIRKQLNIQLRNIFNSSLDIIIIIGFDGLIKKFNPSAEKILGYSHSEAFDKPFSDFIHPEDVANGIEEAKKLLQGNIIHYLENRIIAKNGAVKWFAWTFSPSNEDNMIYGMGKEITEKKNLEEILNRSNSLAKIGSWEVDMITGSVYWSDITKKILEVKKDFIPSFQDSTGNNNFSRKINFIKKKIDGCIQYGESWDEEMLIETFKGNWKWVRSIGDGEFLNGKCIRVFGSIQDINDKKRISQEIIENNERFNLVAKATNDLIWEWNIISGEVYRLGDSFFKSLGYSLNLKDLDWMSIIHPEDKDRVEIKRKHIFENTLENYWEDQYRIIKADGAIAFVLDRGFIVRLSNGKAIKMIGSTQNITKLKQNEIQLSDSEKRYSELFQLSPLPMWVYNIETLQFLDVNMAAISHYGYSKNEFLNMNLKDIRPVEDMTEFIVDIKQTRSNSKGFISGFFRHKKKDGTIINVDVQSNYISFKGIDARVVLANDITERLNYVNTIEEKNQELQQIAWMQSHIMRAPVAKIIGIADIIKKVPLDSEEKLNLLNDLLSSTNELDSIIHEIANKTHEARLR